ncbi:MAG: Riboflavin synthase alpha chain [Alyxoria varia]|nr:MAG: Riboflavin synthase alpha chain [Alyxoria varia]
MRNLQDMNNHTFPLPTPVQRKNITTAVTSLEPLDTSDSGGGGTSLTISDAGPVLGGARLGDSICVNGTCLTITDLPTPTTPTPTTFKVGIAPETLRRTNLGTLTTHSRVNLEAALLATAPIRDVSSSSTEPNTTEPNASPATSDKPVQRISGHFLQGHIDDTATITHKTHDGNAQTFRFQPSRPEILRYIVEKGYVAVDGASLTVTAVDDAQGWFEIMLIAYTREKVVTAGKEVGGVVNVEVDMVGKYVEKSVVGYLGGVFAGGGDAGWGSGGKGDGKGEGEEEGLQGMRMLEKMVERVVDDRLKGR